MRLMAQLAMVMNLDKCIGCHTCSVTCKQAWTNRSGVEYVWFNNVETRPGQGYPRQYQDQQRWKGGWTLNKRGRLTLRSGSRLRRLLSIFANPDLPTVGDYYEPWTYDYETILAAPAMDTTPVATAKSQITGEDTAITWGANWDDDLGGGPEQIGRDPLLARVSEQVKLEFEQTFMFYLPRICEHCLNPSCAAACPSGAIYKRSEDGIVLVDQDRCRGWRQCVTGCPYKKIYFNHKTGKAEKCTFCYPRVEVGIPTVCSETCVGRLRYIGVLFYDADAVLEAASVVDEKELYPAQLGVFLNPHDPRVVAEAERSGISQEWIEAAQDSPVYQLIVDYQLALPLHPEYRTMPMVWYVPPLSPVVEALSSTGHDGEDADNLFGAIDALRIPTEYLAELFTAGDPQPVRASLARLAAMRAHMRRVNLGQPLAPEIAASVRMTPAELKAMYRLLAIAKYEHRYVIPNSAGSQAHRLDALATGCSLDTDGGPGMTAFDVLAEKAHVTDQNESAPPDKRDRINLFNWDGSSTAGLFPTTAAVGRNGAATPGLPGEAEPVAEPAP